MRPNAPGRASATLNALLDSLDFGGRIRENLAIAYWPRVVGPVVARASRAEEVRNGILLIRTKGSVWSQEISLLKHRILPDLNELCGRGVIKDLRFRAGGLPPEGPDETAAGPTEAELKSLTLSDEDRAALSSDLRATALIGDEAIRGAVARLLERGYRLRRWRLEHGWTVCPECLGLFAGGGPVCTVCAASA